MEINENTLQTYLDGELSPEEHSKVTAALDGSAELREQLATLKRRHDRVSNHLSAIVPREQADTARAWQRWQAEYIPQTEKPILINRIGDMMQPSFFRKYQPALSTVAIIAVLALLFSFAPVRAAAGNFLQIFRVQQVKVVPVDMAQVESLTENGNLSALMEQFDTNVAVVSGDTEPHEVANVAAANSAVPYKVRVPNSGESPSTVLVYPQTVVNVQLDRDLVAAVFEAADIAVDLPDSLGDTPLVITKPDTVIMDWSGNGSSLEFMQMPVPQIEYPDDLDLNALGVAGLQLLGMSKAEAEALGATIDFANTLVLPFPTDADMSYREVSINGGQGIVVSNDGASGKNESGLMWQADGMSYFMSGEFTADELVLLAETVK